MPNPGPAGALTGTAVRAYFARTAALAAGVLLVVAIVAAAFLSAGDGQVRLFAEPGGESREFRGNALAILDRYNALASTVGQLLAEQEANPWSQADPGWRGRFDGALAEARALKTAAAKLHAPDADREAATRLSEGLDLYATGLDLLLTGFGMGGHGAYYYGSHGNWDLNLGAQRLQEARQLLTAS